MIRFGYWATLVGWVLLTLCFFVFPSRPIALGSLACVILGWVMMGWRMWLFYRAKRQAAKPVQLTAQQVMRNTRAELPDEYREWFDWTAELAGFERPAPAWRAGPVLIDHSVTKVVYRKPTLPTEYRACPDRTCNVSYGPGAGWTHTDQHTWVEMQT